VAIVPKIPPTWTFMRKSNMIGKLWIYLQFLNLQLNGKSLCCNMRKIKYYLNRPKSKQKLNRYKNKWLSEELN
jgi:hypothetical protein